jgi:hypothetical protein
MKTYVEFKPDPEKGGRGKTNSLAAKGFSTASLSQARTVLRDSRTIASLALLLDLPQPVVGMRHQVPEDYRGTARKQL